MKLGGRLTVAQTAGLAIAGAMLAYLCLWILFIFYIDRWSLLWMLPAAAGIGIMFAGQSAVKDGVRLERWSEDYIGRLRGKLEKSRWTVIAAVLVGAAFVCTIPSFLGIGTAGTHHRPDMAGFLYFWMSPMLVLTQLRLAVKQPETHINPFELRNAGPLISEHWGER
jgi:hypothetical protein